MSLNNRHNSNPLRKRWGHMKQPLGIATEQVGGLVPGGLSREAHIAKNKILAGNVFNKLSMNKKERLKKQGADLVSKQRGIVQTQTKQVKEMSELDANIERGEKNDASSRENAKNEVSNQRKELDRLKEAKGKILGKLQFAEKMLKMTKGENDALKAKIEREKKLVTQFALQVKGHKSRKDINEKARTQYNKEITDLLGKISAIRTRLKQSGTRLEAIESSLAESKQKEARGGTDLTKSNELLIRSAGKEKSVGEMVAKLKAARDETLKIIERTNTELTRLVKKQTDLVSKTAARGRLMADARTELELVMAQTAKKAAETAKRLTDVRSAKSDFSERSDRLGKVMKTTEEKLAGLKKAILASDVGAAKDAINQMSVSSDQLQALARAGMTKEELSGLGFEDSLIDREKPFSEYYLDSIKYLAVAKMLLSMGSWTRVEYDGYIKLLREWRVAEHPHRHDMERNGNGGTHLLHPMDASTTNKKAVGGATTQYRAWKRKYLELTPRGSRTV